MSRNEPKWTETGLHLLWYTILAKFGRVKNSFTG